MPLSIFPAASLDGAGMPVFRFIASSRRPGRRVVVATFFPHRTEQRAQLDDGDFEDFPQGIEVEATKVGIEQIETFLSARGYAHEPFLFKVPDYFERVLGTPGKVPLDGVTNGSNVVFTLPTLGRFRGDYPVNDGNAVVFDDGVSAAISAIDVDLRKFTLSAAPASSSVMKADYHFYRKLALLPGREPSWTYVEHNLWRGSLGVVEVA